MGPSLRRSNTPSKLFWIKSKALKNQYKIEKDLADHVNSCTRVFFAEKDVQEQVLDLHPVPKDIKEAPIMDVVTQGVLDKKGRTNTVAKDNSLRKIQSKIRNAYGPFARIWQDIDDATSGDLSQPVQLDLKKMQGSSGTGLQRSFIPQNSDDNSRHIEKSP